MFSLFFFTVTKFRSQALIILNCETSGASPGNCFTLNVPSGSTVQKFRTDSQKCMMCFYLKTIMKCLRCLTSQLQQQFSRIIVSSQIENSSPGQHHFVYFTAVDVFKYFFNHTAPLLVFWYVMTFQLNQWTVRNSHVFRSHRFENSLQLLKF